MSLTTPDGFVLPDRVGDIIDILAANGPETTADLTVVSQLGTLMANHAEIVKTVQFSYMNFLRDESTGEPIVQFCADLTLRGFGGDKRPMSPTLTVETRRSTVPTELNDTGINLVYRIASMSSPYYNRPSSNAGIGMSTIPSVYLPPESTYMDCTGMRNVPDDEGREILAENIFAVVRGIFVPDSTFDSSLL